jgi:hypothetical protein
LRSYNQKETCFKNKPQCGREARVMQAFIKTWWLLALAAACEAVYAVTNLLVLNPDGSFAIRTGFDLKSTVERMGLLAIAAGACTITAAIWSGRNRGTSLVAVNGAALCTLGLILRFWRGPLAFRTVALLLIVMALSLGGAAVLASPHRSVVRAASAVLIGFALAFLVLGFGWVRPAAPEWLNVWMGAFFGFSALCLAAFAATVWRESAARG